MIDRIQIKSMAKEQIRGNIAALFVCYLVYMVAVSASAIAIVGPIVLAPPLYFGILMLFLGLTRGEKPQLEGMFKGFQIFKKSFLLYLAMSLFTALWSMLLYVPGIIKAISYSFAPYILIENPEIPVMEAIDRSKQITQGHKMELFKLVLSFIPWIMLGMITFGFAMIYVTPYITAAYTNAYLALRGAQESGKTANQ